MDTLFSFRKKSKINCEETETSEIDHQNNNKKKEKNKVDNGEGEDEETKKSVLLSPIALMIYALAITVLISIVTYLYRRSKSLTPEQEKECKENGGTIVKKLFGTVCKYPEEEKEAPPARRDENETRRDKDNHGKTPCLVEDEYSHD